MKIIKVPAEIKVKGSGSEEKEFPFKDVLKFHLDSYVELKTISQIREAAKIIDKIEAATEGISLEDAEYAILKAACGKAVYVPFVTRQLLAYYDSVDQAT